jgi:hypothetical protein
MRVPLVAVAALAAGACAQTNPVRHELPVVTITPAVARVRPIVFRPTLPPFPGTVGDAHGVRYVHKPPYQALPPYTIIIDGRTVATVRTRADTLELRNISAIDPNSIECLAVLRESDAKDRYPNSVGDVILIGLRPNGATSCR